MKDPRIGSHFKDTKPQALKESLTDQICQLSGGPCQYEGGDMKSAHADMDITKAHFNALVEVLQAAMAAQGDLCEIPLKSGRGSSDFGDFSVVCPGIHPYFGIAKGKIPGHSVEFCQAAGTDYAQEQMLRAAAAMADIGLAFLTEPEFAAAVKADFVRQQQNPDVYL